jgi:hypothetical protein
VSTVEMETTPVTVVEAEPWSGACRHGAEEAHSLRAPLVEEPEKAAAVEAPDGAGTPARSRCSVHVVVRPRVAQEEALEPRVARREAPGRWWAQQRVSGPRVAQAGALGPHVV